MLAHTARLSVLAAVVGLACGVWTTSAGAWQPAVPAPQDDSTPMYGRITPEGYTARLLARIATLDLRFVTQVGPRDYQIAATLFGLAQDITPDDADIVRRRYEAALSGGDTDLVMQLTRRLARLDPADEVSLLRLISGKLGALQTAEERMALYERLLGPEGKELPVGILSRLALDEALLKREQGDIDGFADRLALAVKLDSTHKEAAALAATYYSDQVGDAAGRMQLLVNLLYADPLDPNVHESLSKLLARAGAWQQAKRFHDNGVTLVKGPQGTMTDPLYIESEFLLWRTQGPQLVVDDLNLALESVRKQTVQQIANEYSKAAQEANARGQSPPPAPQVDLSKVTLPLTYERLRLLAAQCAGDAATLEQAAANIELVQLQAVDAAKKSAPDEAAATRASAMAMLDLQTTRLWAGIQTEKVQKFAAEYPLPAATAQDEVIAQVAVGAFLKIRTGDPQGAIAMLSQFPDEIFLKDVGLALAYEQTGEPAKAIEHLKRLAAQPFSIPGAWAISRLDRLNVPQVEVFPEAAHLSALAAGVSKGLDRMITDPRAFMSLSVEPITTTPGPIGQIGYTVTIKNISPIPLSVGGDRVINTRLLFAPKMEADLDKVISSAVPEVCEVDRRLRLAPGEEMTAVVHPEYGWAGYSLEAAVSRSTKIRWRILQGFRMAQQGMYESGQNCLTAETPVVIRPALPETRLPVASLCAKLHDDAEAALPVTIAAIRSLLTGPQNRDGTPLLTSDEVSQIAQAATERYARLTPLGRKMLLVGLPPSRMIPGSRPGDPPPLKPFDDSCRSEQDPGVMAIFLATRVSDDQDPTLSAAAQSADAKLGTLARLLAARLASGANTYARLPAQQQRPADTGAQPPGQGNQGDQGGQKPPDAAPGSSR